ncbi:SulP family inorganic anion transporter [Thalassolituus sp. LLYu03]|uniref:SulP family inorganic anion transporter n=1 Tax=Thalassolituus sp. LLYu03 TaxID=3421656 RepID=UPI003D29AD64
MKLTNTLTHYQKPWLSADLIAGIIVAVLITPQAIAYALLAGLPPQAGLYAALLPVVIYAFTGTSPMLAVGPVAIISLMTFEALHTLATPGSAEYMTMATALALLTGLWLLLFFLIDLGKWTNFISHSVISAFTSATAILIVISQLRHLTGLPLPASSSLWHTLSALPGTDHTLQPPLLIVSLAGIGLLLSWQWLIPWITRPLPGVLASLLNKSGPLIIVIAGILLVQKSTLALSVVGDLPHGLPALSWPALPLSQWQGLIPSAAVLALIGYLSSLSVAKALEKPEHTRVNANQELLALGLSNLAAAFTQAFPVAGGFGRSVINQASGARTQLAGIITAILVALICLFASQFFSSLPHVALAVIVVTAVWPLIQFAEGWQAWRFHKSDGLIWAITFVAVLMTGAESGILLGMGLSLALYLKRSSEPHIAEVGRVGSSDHFRNVLRHQVTTRPDVLLVRIDENLYFANSQYLLDYVSQRLCDKPSVQHVVVVGSAINHIDFSGYQCLSQLLDMLTERGIRLHLAEFKGPVMDQLARSDLIDRLAPGQVFFTASDALRELGGV